MLGLLERGDLFLHEDTRSGQFQAWIWDGVAWKNAEDGIPHPIYGGKRRLWFRFMKEEGRYDPNWITRSSWTRYKNIQRQEIERWVLCPRLMRSWLPDRERVCPLCSGLPASPMFKGVNARV